MALGNVAHARRSYFSPLTIGRQTANRCCTAWLLSKAFDKVPHQRLFLKLKHYGVRGNLETFLSARTQEVVIDGAKSSPLPVNQLSWKVWPPVPCLYQRYARACHIQDQATCICRWQSAIQEGSAKFWLPTTARRPWPTPGVRAKTVFECHSTLINAKHCESSTRGIQSAFLKRNIRSAPKTWSARP